MKVLLAASEAVPFIKTGGLADVMGALPAKLRREGVETALVIPKYAQVAENTVAGWNRCGREPWIWPGAGST